MYPEERKITVFSECHDLEDLIKTVMKAGPITYHIITTSVLQDGWQDSDVIICDMPVKRLGSYRGQMKEGAYLIYICNPVCEICEDKDEAADELLIRPVSGAYFRKRLEKICGWIKHWEDSRLSAMFLDVLISRI